MTKRKIVKIDEEKCTGCGECVPSCAEGAIQIVDGKAKLIKEIYCDGLGACLGDCPEDAITIEEREAEAFDPVAVTHHLEDLAERETPAPTPAQAPAPQPAFSGCPGAAMRKFAPAAADAASATALAEAPSTPSQLGQWPVQLHLLPPQGPIWQDADVLIAADCVPFAMPDFHQRLLAGKTVAVGCPKLDDLSAYVEKLTTVFKLNDVRSVTVAYLEVPCCTGIMQATKTALEQAGRTDIEFHQVVIGIKGAVLSEIGD